MRHISIISLMLLLIAIHLTCRNSEPTSTVTVFAAASTTHAITEISNLFSQKSGVQVISSFASSSTLAKQIKEGAPADIYISANPQWMDYLEENNKLEPKSRFDLLGNQIVLITPLDRVQKIEITRGFDLAGLLGSDRLSMGDPDHVPAGIYGKQALQALKVWDSVSSNLARTNDVRAALALVERKEAPLGIVYATDAAISKKVRVVGVFPAKSHPPITYPVATVRGKSTPIVAAFLRFLQSEESKAVFEQNGFIVN